MPAQDLILRLSLAAGALYFLGVFGAHTLGVKVPLLYIYFNVPSTAYQDRIIGTLALGWGIFLAAGARSGAAARAFTPPILAAGAAALVSVAFLNRGTDFQGLSPDATPRLYWLQWGVLVAYFAEIAVIFFAQR